MKCFYSECACPKCERFRNKECWRVEKCLKNNRAGYCPGYVEGCSKYINSEVKKDAQRP